MKKVMFVQNEGNVIGGVWYVNKTIAEQLLKKGYEVQIISIRNGQIETELEYDNNLVVKAINPDLPWKLTRKKEVIAPLKRLKTFDFLSMLKHYIFDQIRLKKDYKKLKKYIRFYNPDYIIASHYMVLDGIPKEYLNRTVHEQHSSFDEIYNIRKNRKILMKYDERLHGLIWLSKSAYNEAIKLGFKNNLYIYNPVKFDTLKGADVCMNKKLVVISRIEEENKRIGLMVKIADKVLNNSSLKDWTFDIYGVGEFSAQTKSIIDNNSRINYMGPTNDPMSVLLNSSINLNTSVFEGFSLSILEAAMCGIPTISFEFGESVFEEILNNKTGNIIKQNDVEEYIKVLSDLMNDNKKLNDYSNNCKKFSKKFLAENIILDWINLFQTIDNRKGRG